MGLFSKDARTTYVTPKGKPVKLRDAFVKEINSAYRKTQQEKAAARRAAGK